MTTHTPNENMEQAELVAEKLCNEYVTTDTVTAETLRTLLAIAWLEGNMAGVQWMASKL